MSAVRQPSYGDVTGEYLAARGGAGLAAGSHDLTWVTGDDAVSFLDGQLSQDIAAMEPGSIARSLLLEPRGKLKALLWVLRGEDRVGLVSDRGQGAVVVEQLERFRFRVDATISLDGRPVAVLWGPGSADVLRAAGHVPPVGWRDEDQVLVAALPVGVPRYLTAGDAGLDAAGATPIGTIAETAVRIEAGEPVMGIDVDESTIPQETGLVPEAVSFTKGCYLGQELVARIDSRGRVNRHLRGIVLRDTVLPPPGAEVVSGGDPVGTITSVGESMELRAPVALAMVRREVEPGSGVEIRWAGGSASAEVRNLPLAAFGGSDTP
ncbi:MAG TPA: glycine cleavage T C-terminal barrel domain-containing protein [Acidimicrobiia bacterium]|nr:glycine cleavage T C-terminal barrel domain-containing protein [Acidimicrobiia bacterium]